jgi:hypothetical protein
VKRSLRILVLALLLISNFPVAAQTSGSWVSLGTWTVGCNSQVTFPSVNARQFKFQMLSGGGPDNQISFYGAGSNGAAWLVNGVWKHVTNQSFALRVNEWRETALFISTSVNQQWFRVGCNDGETMTAQVYYLPGQNSYLPVIAKPPRLPPAPTTSRYIGINDSSVLQQQGCNQATQGEYGLVVLDFGAPTGTSSNTYGATLFGAGPVYTSQIKSLVQAFLQGYWSCSTASQAITVSVGTSNCSLGIGTGECPLGGTNVTYGHGHAWAYLIKELSDWVLISGYSSREAIVGGSDIELNWNYASVTKDWVLGYLSVYQSVSGARPYYNYGTCDSCPYDEHPTWLPPHDWTHGDIWFVSWGALPAHPLPEIYATDGQHAAQWYTVALNALNCGTSCSSLCVGTSYCTSSNTMRFKGTLTTCKSLQGPCPETNTPAQGWTQLYTELSVTTANPGTFQDIYDLLYSTDITGRALP